MVMMSHHAFATCPSDTAQFDPWSLGGKHGEINAVLSALYFDSSSLVSSAAFLAVGGWENPTSQEFECWQVPGAGHD